MEAPVQHGVSRSIIAAVIGAVMMAAAIAGISLSANAGTTNNADQPAASEEATPTTAAPAEPDQVPSTTIAFETMDEEAMAEWDMEYEEVYGEYDQCMQESGVYDLEQELFENGEPSSDEEWMAIEEEMSAAWDAADAECSLLLPEEIQIENAAWQAHSECVEGILGDDFWSDEVWDEQAYQDADRECRSVLPQEIQDELAAWDAYEACTAEFIGEEEYYGAEETVSFSSMDDYLSYVLGDGDSTITITKVDGEVTVTADGDVIVQDEAFWAAQDAKWMEAEEECASLMPEMDGPFGR